MMLATKLSNTLVNDFPSGRSRRPRAPWRPGAVGNQSVHAACSQLFQGRRLLYLSAVVCCFGGAITNSAMAEIAQFPLSLSRVPPPNIMFILDNSFSMAGGSLTGDDVKGEYTSDAYNADKMNQTCDNCSESGKKDQEAYYSSDWNQIYYNPSVRYTPAVTATGVAMGNIDPKKAPVDAYAASAKLNLESTCNVSSNKLPSYDPDDFLRNENCGYGNTATNKALYAFHYSWPNPDVQPTGSKKEDQLYLRKDIVPGTPSYKRAEERTDCIANADATCTYKEEIQNFANWFSYYRTRMLMTKTTLGIAFSGLDDRFRIGLSTINKNSDFFIPVGGFDAKQKALWYKKLYLTDPVSSTPLIAALNAVGAYYQGFGMPGMGPLLDPIQNQCQRNYAVLSTDGFWNATLANGRNLDQTLDFDLPAAIKLDPVSGTEWISGKLIPRPFYEGPTPTSDSLADTAMKYWATDIGYRKGAGGTAGKLTPNDTNPATWQHMATYTVGLGINGELAYQSDYQTATSGDYFAIKEGKKEWPVPKKNTRTTIDDMWHAAVNGRGSYLHANNPTDLKYAMQTVFRSIDGQDFGGGSGIAYNGAALSNDRLLYVPGFTPGNWLGHLKAYQVAQDNSTTTQKWDAAEQLPASQLRNIVTWNQREKKGIEFKWKNLNTEQQTYLKSSSILDYLRGSAALERAVDGSGANPYRHRKNKLGDIVNSSPLYVGKTDFGFSNTTFTFGTSYPEFLKRKSERNAMLYVGANDGMLHGFDAKTGIEQFAFIPNSVFPYLSSLTDPDYKHRYFVDGPLTEGDAYLSDVKEWKNILLGSTGAGSHSMFAIDITNPDSQGLNSKSILWERSDTDQNFNDLGNVLGTGAIARLGNGTWAAIFGNGYNSVGGKAVLYLNSIFNGDLIRTLDTNVGTPTAPNGLSSPGLLFNNERTLIAAYAGDLQGNLWKFDLRYSNSSQWKLVKMFTAKTAGGKPVPIVQQPVLTSHPKGGYIITFGTGKYYELADLNDKEKHTLYGIWDKPDESVVASPKERKDLQAQTLTSLQKNGVTIGRILTNNTIDWNSKHGWFIDMPLGGERFVGRLAMRENVLLSTTLTPDAGANACKAGGTSFTMAIDLITGGIAKNFHFVGADGKPIKDAKGNNASAIATGGTTSGGVSIPGVSNDCIAINQLDGTTTCVPYASTSEVIRRWRRIYDKKD